MTGPLPLSRLLWALWLILGAGGAANASTTSATSLAPRFEPSAPAGSFTKIQLISTLSMETLDVQVTGLGNAADNALEEQLRASFARHLHNEITDETLLLVVSNHTKAGTRLDLKAENRESDFLLLPAPAIAPQMLPGGSAHPFLNNAYGLRLWAGESEQRAGSWRLQPLLNHILSSNEFFESARKNASLQALPWTGEMQYQGQNSQGDLLFRFSAQGQSEELARNEGLSLRIDNLNSIGQQLYLRSGLPKSAFYFGSAEMLLNVQEGNAKVLTRFALRWTSAMRPTP